MERLVFLIWILGLLGAGEAAVILVVVYLLIRWLTKPPEW